MKKMFLIVLLVLGAASVSFGAMLMKDDDRLIEVSCKSPSPKCEECISKCEDLESAKEKLDCVEECDVEIKVMF